MRVWLAAPAEEQRLVFHLNPVGPRLVLLASSGGIGLRPGGFAFAMRGVPDARYGGVRDMHNWWAQVLVEYGVLIFVLYVAAHMVLLRRVLAGVRRARSDGLRLAGEALLCSLAGFAVASMSPSSIVGLPVHWALTWLCIAFVAVTSRHEETPCTS